MTLGGMDHNRVKAEFDRITATAHLEKQREIIAQYKNGLHHAFGVVEKLKYRLGRLDERLGGGQ